MQLRRLVEGYTRSSTLARRFRETPVAAERASRILGSSRVLGLAMHRHPEVVDALKDIRKALEAPQGSFVEIASIRQKQVEYLRATNKFPDFIDVGLDVWFSVHDWHIKHLQPITLGRDAGGRYTVTLLATTLVLKTDADRNFISIPYDNR